MSRILLVTDLHYAGRGERSSIPTRRGDLIPALLDGIRQRESGLSALLCMGDVIEKGRDPGASADWETMKAAFSAFGVPFLAIPGNHDRIPAAFAAVFGAPEVLRLPDAEIFPFVDAYDEHDVCTRALAAMENALAAPKAAGRLRLAIQHNTVYPAIQSDYPYLMPQYREIGAAYAKYGVDLSLSGHYHRGIPETREQGVTYYAGCALCEAPFRYAILTVEGGAWRIEEKTLS